MSEQWECHLEIFQYVIENIFITHRSIGMFNVLWNDTECVIIYFGKGCIRIRYDDIL